MSGKSVVGFIVVGIIVIALTTAIAKRKGEPVCIRPNVSECQSVSPSVEPSNG